MNSFKTNVKTAKIFFKILKIFFLEFKGYKDRTLDRANPAGSY